MTRTKKGALVVEINGELHCAEDFTIVQERPVLGNIYGGIVLPGITAQPDVQGGRSVFIPNGG